MSVQRENLKKSLLFHKLNNSTIFKAVLTGILIVLVEIVCGTLIYDSYCSYTYAEIYTEYESYAERAAEDAAALMGEDVDYSLPEEQARLREILGGGYVLFSEAGGGRIAGEGWVLSGTLSQYGIDGLNSSTFELDGTTYIFASHSIGGVYRIGLVEDFTSRAQAISGLVSNMVAYLVITGVLILAVFIVYVGWSGYRVFTPKHFYKFTVDGEGKVLAYNKKFRNGFGAITKLDVDFSKFLVGYNLISINGVNGSRTLSFTVDKLGKKYVVRGDEIMNSSGAVGVAQSEGGEVTSTGKAMASLSKAFDEFVHRGKRTLIGIIVISNLNQISVLFGKQMALDVQKEVIRKAHEKFNYVYELDFGRIGIACPDGNKFNAVISEMGNTLNYLGQPIKMDDNLFAAELKSGFAVCDDTMPELTFEYAMQAAEAALQRCIDTKVADFLVYHEAQKNVYTKYFIKYNIKEMLSEGAFELEYQPQYSISGNRIEGFEALFRVKKSWNVNVDTFSFITYAERTGAMVQLGDFIFDTGMRFAKQLEGKGVSVSLNVSPVQLMQAGFTENFLRIFKKYDLKPGSVCVEITESFLMANFDETVRKLSILKENGIEIHLDDFGTEYSSLLYIKKIPVSAIKIDKEFTNGLLKDKASQAIIRFITNIARLISCTTICEGVETPQEFDMLKAIGCDTVQGWLIRRSMKPEDALKIIDTFDYEAAAAAKNAQLAQIKQPKFAK